MMNPIKEAADRLLSRGEITGEEYNSLNFDNMEKIAKDFGGFKFFTSGLEGKAVKKLWEKAIIPGIIAGTGITLMKESLIDPAAQAMKIKHSFGKLTEKTPQLAEKDQDKIKDYFNVIKTFSPKAASNPLVAGALVNKMMEFGGVDHKLVQDIASIESGTTPTLQKAREKATGLIMETIGVGTLLDRSQTGLTGA